MTYKCTASRRADGKHSWVFDGDDPYVICGYCAERRDALTERVVPAENQKVDREALQQMREADDHLLEGGADYV